MMILRPNGVKTDFIQVFGHTSILRMVVSSFMSSRCRLRTKRFSNKVLHRGSDPISLYGFLVYKIFIIIKAV